MADQDTSKPGATETEQILGPDDTFQFSCNSGLDCFTSCCRDVSIFLTPYDVMRLRRRLDIGSREFLDKHTLVSQAHVVPIVLLRMDEERDKRCPFVTEAGCSVYEDRPWACRMFPLDLGEDGGYRMAAGPERCHGIGQGEVRRVRAYLESQGTAPYVAAEQDYAALTGDPRIGSLDVDNPSIFKMVMMATYNLDAFREFIFESTFLERFALPLDRVETLRGDDGALLVFGLEWLEFGLFGRMSFQVSEQAAQRVEAKVAAGDIPGVATVPPGEPEGGASGPTGPGAN